MLIKTSTLTALIGAALLITGTTSTALAQDATVEYEDYEEEERGGLLFGIGVDAGHLACESIADIGCEGVTPAGGLSAHLGLMLSPSFAIVGNIWSMGHMDDRLFVSQSMASVGPRLWLGDRLWIEGGVGLARVSFNYDAGIADVEDSTDNVVAATAAAGFEFISTKDFGLDLHLRGGAGVYSEDPDLRVRNVGIGLGATWY